MSNPSKRSHIRHGGTTKRLEARGQRLHALNYCHTQEATKGKATQQKSQSVDNFEHHTHRTMSVSKTWTTNCHVRTKCARLGRYQWLNTRLFRLGGVQCRHLWQKLFVRQGVLQVISAWRNTSQSANTTVLKKGGAASSAAAAAAAAPLSSI